MQLEFASRGLERQCTEERQMKRAFGAEVAKALRLRITELRYATEMNDLLHGIGRWEQLRGDRAEQWSARLSANWRLIVQPIDRETITVMVIEITDYHGR